LIGKKWEYFAMVMDFDIVVEINGEGIEAQKINAYKKITELGQDCWELVGLTQYAGMRNVMLVFKRPI
jgi:hypothetical protein